METKRAILLALNSLSAIFMIIISYYMIRGGYSVYAATDGRVYGTSFEMLITITNELSLIMLWLAVIGLTVVFNLLIKSIFVTVKNESTEIKKAEKLGADE